MAISDLLPGIEITVCVDGIQLVEYDNNDIKIKSGTSDEKKALASKTISRYIEALTDKNFAVNVAMNEAHKSNYANDGSCLIVKITIDGITIHESSLTLFDTGASRWKIHARGVYSVEDGVEGFKPFAFSKLAISEDESVYSKAIRDAQCIEGVGEIIVSFHRGNITGSYVTAKPSPGFRSTEMNMMVEEELHVKAVTIGQEFQSHGTKLSSLVPYNQKYSYGHLRYIAEFIGGRDESCIGRFSFKYRSKEILKSFLIIDQTPEGSPERTIPPEIVPPPPCKPSFFLPVPAILRRFASTFSNNSNELSLDQSRVSKPSNPEPSVAGPSTPTHYDNTDQRVKQEESTEAPSTHTNCNGRSYSFRPKRANFKREAEDNEEENLSSPQKRARARKEKAKAE
ncbi:predicted protein [Sclerotinia sclerotiorum 1980 UF-70]|uniref:DUF7918 domain-containing protein n=2 Tax=Sclerotinia sclerotiorum (strain ATCC 18683 / 1980 / Ss-1) TaxID=665079 RepID=A7EKL6_SCLS1|nr:predicted protein [Sclerotinia sclerotiorum 1980 UF-70]APA09893.1 hypothetical protein sscle_05g046630 [Sclerotinia sclerotiorum 1980 UF-70]EDO03382.1 predicted protein [Sclerotinia sclerotiorum 1980 UF-70]